MEIQKVGDWSRRITTNATVAVGNFDGVHRGHAALVAEAVRGEGHGEPVVLTFDPHPARVVHRGGSPSALVTLDQKAELLAALGVSTLVVLDFTEEVARTPPEVFVESVLVGMLGARRVCVGEAFRFGRGRSGGVATLETLGPRMGFAVTTVRPIMDGGAPISSSRIRAAVGDGDVRLARRLLGRAFFVEGSVVTGDARGRQLGFPTANIRPVNETLPREGVYAGRVRGALTAEPKRAIINLGRRPTFGGHALHLEAHLLGFEGDLYGQTLRVEFVERLRDERRFASVDELVAQLRDDATAAEHVLEEG